MRNLITSEIGLVHLIFSILSLIFGTIILFIEKGTKRHKKIGYAYVVSMLGVIVTSFLMYRLFGKFGIFHVAALVSAVTIGLGMIPAILRKPAKSWFSWHYNFMYWSIIGLYAAFAAELLVRVPQQPFFRMVGIASFGVTAIGGIFFAIYKKKWAKMY
ncbi:MAG: hypothetical protein MUC29_10175 [Pyrinomonadaceae bacterium]|jgi:uncharacterized membrane protein|nr:hypothetical protein [Pyrinomonadaceae bacterium]